MPSPLFLNKLTNSLNTSLKGGSKFIPPVNPNAVSLQLHQKDKKEVAPETKGINEEKSKVKI